MLWRYNHKALNTHDLLLCFTDRGKVYRENVFALPELGRYAKGRAAVNFLNMSPSERIHAILPIAESAPITRNVFPVIGTSSVKARSSCVTENHTRTS